MNTIEAIVLGIIQGLTEFLPISSSGHLELVKSMFNSNVLPAESLQMTVVLHAATALSTIVVFRNDILQIIKDLFQFKNNSSFKFSLNILLSMIPAAFVGIFFDEEIEQFFTGNILMVGCMLMITAVMLILADKAKNTEKPVNTITAIIIGISQAIAILPGISRSGATISTAVLLGIDREKAARFSFLMVVPLILGKIAKDILDGAFSMNMENILILIVGFLFAFLTGLLACKWMIRIVKNSQLIYFSLYCFLIGGTAVVFDLFFK